MNKAILKMKSVSAELSNASNAVNSINKQTIVKNLGPALLVNSLLFPAQTNHLMDSTSGDIAPLLYVIAAHWVIHILIAQHSKKLLLKINPNNIELKCSIKQFLVPDKPCHKFYKLKDLRKRDQRQEL